VERANSVKNTWLTGMNCSLCGKETNITRQEAKANGFKKIACGQCSEKMIKRIDEYLERKKQ